ncbi:hypothetical protein BC937DRAFT_92909 [Endogone sp. FLAS-F59071]|nr:hypothetical protein BC937DRAFT_92909 [Endogone sp. FLAS-F59071]|eukprot:RUS15095.1 hypothetical protein BC937DRAFT_92909 [Endogone sp. FLAS-F59071]
MKSIHQEFLASKGFPLTNIINLMGKELVYRGRIKNQHIVAKQINKFSGEYSVASFLSKDSPQNHTIPFLGILDSDKFEEAFLVMPKLQSLRDCPIEDIAQWKDFSMQLLEGVAFMHCPYGSNARKHLD